MTFTQAMRIDREITIIETHIAKAEELLADAERIRSAEGYQMRTMYLMDLGFMRDLLMIKRRKLEWELNKTGGGPWYDALKKAVREAEEEKTEYDAGYPNDEI